MRLMTAGETVRRMILGVCVCIGSQSLLAERAPEVVGRLVELPNPGAELADPDKPELPAAVGTWTSPGGTSSYSRDTSVSRTGAASFHIVNQGHPTNPDSYSGVFDISVEAFPGLTYTASVYVRAAEGVNESGFLVLGSASGNMIPGPATRQFVKGATDWKKLTLRFSPTIGDTHFRLLPALKGKGEAWFDDIELRDNAQEIVATAFPPLRAELARLRTEAASLGADFPSTDLAAIGKALTKAERIEKETSQIAPDSEVSAERWRVFFEARKEFDDTIVSYGRRVSIQKALAGARRLTGESDPPYIVGFAPATVHVFIEDRPFSIEVSECGKILAVRGEREALQLVILPLAQDLSEVRVSVSDLKSATGTIPAAAVSVNPVGYVHIKSPLMAFYPQEPVYVGWWPDPVLPNFAFDVAREKTQPVWISVRVPRDTQAGSYVGQISIKPGNAPESRLGLEVEVADVDLPETWRYKNLLCWDDGHGPIMYGDRWTEKLRTKFIDFQIDRRINVGGLWGATQKRVTVEDMIDYARRGQNVIFTYQFWWGKKMTDAAGKPLTTLPGKIRDWLGKLKEAGFYDRAIVYGWDECGPEMYPHMRIAAELLARDYPGIPLLMAGVDESCGTKSILGGLPNIAFCPFMTQWDPDAVLQAKASGNEIWWYDVYWTVEQHLIRSRLIPWQSYKVGAEGFLIWSMNRWKGNDNLVSSKQIRTVWKPYLDGSYRSNTAMYVYPGEDGPISSLRLENFTDGCEDYDLLATAHDLLTEFAERKDIDPAVVERLRAAITLEDEFVKDAFKYSTDPGVLRAHRRALIDALAAASRHSR